MKLAVIGSRGLTVDDLSPYIPADTDEIISGGAKGIDTCAREYARKAGLRLTEFQPEYERYGRYAAPLKRNEKIVEAADRVLAFWDGASRGTRYTVDYAKKLGKPVEIIRIG